MAGWFYPDPPPTQSVTFTLPWPHVPIGTQGTPPPSVQVQQAAWAAQSTTAWQVSWPAQGGPKLTPFVPPVSQPTPVFPLSGSNSAILVGTQWALTWAAQTGAKLTPFAGAVSQPVPVSALAPVTAGVLANQWQVTWPAQGVRPSAAWNVPLLTGVPWAPPRLLYSQWEIGWSAQRSPVTPQAGPAPVFNPAWAVDANKTVDPNLEPI